VSLKRFIKFFLPKWAIRGLGESYFVRRLRLWRNFVWVVGPVLRRQLQPTDTMRTDSCDLTNIRILIPLIETVHYQYLQLLILAKALSLRGADVKVLVCGQNLTGCEIKSVRNKADSKPCWSCWFNETNVLPFFGLNIIRIDDVITKQEQSVLAAEATQLVAARSQQIIRHGVDLDVCIEDSVVRYFYGAVPDDVSLVDPVRVAHTSTALTSVALAERIDRQWSPHVVLTNMPCYSAWEPYYRFFYSNGRRFCQLSMSQFNFRAVVVNQYDLFPAASRFRTYLLSRRAPSLDSNEKAELEDFVQVRRKGAAEIFVQDGYFDSGIDADALAKKLGIDETKRNIFLFSNLHWDVGLSDRSGLFRSVVDWVLDTVESVRDVENLHLYVKPHPAEVYGTSQSLKGVAQIIRETYPDGLPNVTIVEPHWKINTYDLFPYIDLGVIFNGTLGLEMMLDGIPVVSTGLTTHQGLGFACEPQTLDEYHETLRGTRSTPEFDRRELEMFAFFFFMRTRIPWRLTETSYGHADSKGFAIDELADLLPGNDPYLDHLCMCVGQPGYDKIDAWPTETRGD
jgi:hypothetical protein